MREAIWRSAVTHTHATPIAPLRRARPHSVWRSASFVIFLIGNLVASTLLFVTSCSRALAGQATGTGGCGRGCCGPDPSAWDGGTARAWMNS